MDSNEVKTSYGNNIPNVIKASEMYLNTFMSKYNVCILSL